MWKERWHWLAAMALLWTAALLWASPARADTLPPQECQPQAAGRWEAQETQAGQRPTQGWEAIELPHAASELRPDWTGPVWYQVAWQLNCPPTLGVQRDAHLALAISGIRMAGTVYWNDELLWSDRSLVEPLSRSWNMPRWWPVSTRGGGEVQTAWVRVVGAPSGVQGLGYVELGDATRIQEAYATRYWRQRTAYVVTGGLSLAIACVSLVVWLWRRSEQIYLWMGLMQACWTLYLGVILSTEPWPWLSSQDLGLLNRVSFMLYAQCFFIFMLRFGGQRLVKLERASWGALVVWVLLMLPAEQVLPQMGKLSLVWGAVLFNGSCWYFPYRAWRTREPQHLLLAACCLVMTVVGLHDIVVALRHWDNDQTWASFFWPLNMVLLALLLGWQVAKQMRRMDRFNEELTTHVAQARADLAHSLEREHARALQHAKLQERVQIAHDLHDGLGGSLVRSMALVEQAPEQLSNDRVMSLLKTLRDDLRQVIDSGSSNGLVVPDTPAQWIAPLRHRFVRILDEVGMQAQWQIAPAWQQRPSALQCLALTRFLEEAFANVLKHSRAGRMTVCCTQPTADTLVLSVEDDGLGFEVPAVLAAGMSVGMRSMQSRMARIGGRLEVQSTPGCTRLTAWVQLVDGAAGTGAEAAAADSTAVASV